MKELAESLRRMKEPLFPFIQSTLVLKKNHSFLKSEPTLENKKDKFIWSQKKMLELTIYLFQEQLKFVILSRIDFRS